MKSVLKLKRDDIDKEIEFELKYLGSLSIRQRFGMCFQKSKQMRELLKRSGHRKAFEVIKRT